jgi:lipoprotein-releasing system permease protein
MRFELFIALRYLLAGRKQSFVSLISLISVIGVAVGVAALVIALALMTGLQGELRDRILGSMSHIYVWRSDGIDDYHAETKKLSERPGVTGAAPAITGQGLVSTDRADAPLSIKGIDPALEPMVTDLGRSMRSGSVEALGQTEPGGRPGVLLGKDLAGKLGVAVGDSAYAFVSLEFAQKLFAKTRPDLIQLRVADIYDAPAIADRIVAELGPGYVAQDWSDINQSLFSALWLEKMGISIAILLIVIVGALNIISSLVLLVMEKSRDIAILKTMGAPAKKVMSIFLLQGSIIGLAGTCIGGALGLVLCRVFDRYRLLQIPVDVYQISYVPFVVLPFDFTMVIVAALAICFLSTIYPARQASRLDPVQALRFE